MYNDLSLILGPQLFIAYINDLNLRISNHVISKFSGITKVGRLTRKSRNTTTCEHKKVMTEAVSGRCSARSGSVVF